MILVLNTGAEVDEVKLTVDACFDELGTIYTADVTATMRNQTRYGVITLFDFGLFP